MVRHRVRHAHRLIRHIHIRTKVQHRRTIAMRPRRIRGRSWHVRSHRTVCRIRVAHVPLGLVRIATITMRQIRLVHQRIVLNRLPVQRVRQIIMELRRVLRVIRHIHIRTKVQHRRTTVMHPRRIQGRSWHARSHRTVCRIRVAHVPLGHVRGATIRMRQIRLVRRLIVQSRLPVQRVRQIIMELRRVLRVIRRIRIRTKEQHHRITVMHPRRIQGRSWHARSQRTVRRTPVVRVPLGLVRIATIRMQQIRHVRRLIVLNRLPVQRVMQIIMELHRVQRVRQIHPVRRDLMHVQTARVTQGMAAMQQQVHVQSVQQGHISPVRVMHRVGHVLRGIIAPVVRIELRAQARQRMRRIPLGQNTIRHRSRAHQ